MGVEQLDRLGEVGQARGQPLDLVDHDNIDPAVPGSHHHPVKEALDIPVEIAQPFGLEAIGDHAVEQMAMIGGLAAKHLMPSSLQPRRSRSRKCAISSSNSLAGARP